jgi:hypothetical protein
LTNVTHVTVKNNLPPWAHEPVVVGKLYSCTPKFEVETTGPAFTAAESEDEPEVKVIKPRGRRPASAVTEADTKAKEEEDED